MAMIKSGVCPYCNGTLAMVTERNSSTPVIYHLVKTKKVFYQGTKKMIVIEESPMIEVHFLRCNECGYISLFDTGIAKASKPIKHTPDQDSQLC